MKQLSILLLMLTLGSLAGATNYEVVPLPRSVEPQKGEPFVLSADVQIVAPPALLREAQFLQSYMRELTGLSLPIAEHAQRKARCIRLACQASDTNKKANATAQETFADGTNAEAYTLSVAQKGISVVGNSPAGVFYAIQTLRKAIGTADDARRLSPVLISDAPRFGWRGMHLDCSRHFFGIDFVKKYIDMLALHNMNVFHWHITDDQGWRIEIKKWPRLTQVGSMRSGTVMGCNSDLDDCTPHGGYYTQDEARQIVEYARERHITVVPEIDMPGHMLAALASYPELGCTGGPYEVGHFWGVYKDVLCVSNERVYQFVEDVLEELTTIFPSDIIHIGGDETPTDRWTECPRCQQLQATLPEGQTLQGHFTRRVFDMLAARQRRALGWDELLDNNAPPSTIIMSWRGTEPGAKAATAGHDVVMAPTSHCYFDYQQHAVTDHEPSRCSGLITLEKVYALDPVPDSIGTQAASHILGVQANLWAEYLTTTGLVEYQALPRASALAEVQWTQPTRKHYDDFLVRLTRLTRLYERYGYQYAKHQWPERQLPSRWQF